MNTAMFFELNDDDREQLSELSKIAFEKVKLKQDTIAEKKEMLTIHIKAHERAMKYYKAHLDELPEALKQEIKINAIFLAETEERIKEKDTGLETILRENLKNNTEPYLEMLKEKSPKDYEELISFIDYAFEHRKFFPKEESNAIAKEIANMPTGSMLYHLQEVITAGGREGINALPERKRLINHGGKYSIERGDSMKEEQGTTLIRHDFSDKRSYLRFSIPDNIIDEKLGYGIYTKKILFFVLEKIDQQVYHDGKITRDFITFPAQELIDRKLYKTPRSAREGFESAMNILTSIKVQGELWYAKRPSISVYQLSVLFPTARYENGECKVFLNQQIGNWKFIFQAFSILPKYYYELSPKPSELLYYIFFLARQHTADIKERGYFMISFRALQQAMHLPSEKKTEHPKRDILDAINDAIDCIDKAQIKYYGNEDLLSLFAEYNDKTNITTILNEGYLQVNLSGEFALPFIEFEEDKLKKLKEAQRRRTKALPE